MTKGPCYDDQFLIQLAHGHLGEAETETAFEHIDECRDCQQRFEQIPLEAGDLLENVRTPVSKISRAQPVSQANRFTLEDSAEDQLEWLGSRRIIKKLDAGGMGSVYLCKHQKLDRYEAVKLFPEEWKSRPLLRARFSREAKAFAKLDHPNVVRAWDADEIDGRPYIAMEYLPGLSVAKLIRRHSTLPIPVACEITRQAAEGLHYVHLHHLVHRDIKPGNLVVLQSGLVKLVDFGLVLDHEDCLEALTAGNERLGTSGYTAPEQLRDSHSADHRADVYGLAASFVAMVSGSPPLGQLCLPEDAPVELVQLLQEMLQPNRELRLANCHEVAQRLEPWCGNEELKRLAKGESASSQFKPLRDFSHFVSTARPSMTLSNTAEASPHGSPLRSLPSFAFLMLLAVWLYYDPSRSLVLSWFNEGHTEVEHVVTRKPSVETVHKKYQGHDLQEWFKLLADGQTPQELRTAIEAIVILACTPEEQQQATQQMVVTLRRIPNVSNTRFNATLPNNATLEDLRNGLFVMPPNMVISTLLNELQFGNQTSQTLTAGILKEALHGRQQLQNTVRIRRNEISEACLNVAEYSAGNNDALQLYVETCEMEGLNPTANPRAYELLKKRALNFKDANTRRLSVPTLFAWELLVKYAPETPELESSLVTVTCYTGMQIPTWDRQAACRVLSTLKHVTPAALQQLALYAKDYAEQADKDPSLITDPRGDRVFMTELLRLLRKHYPEQPLPFELDSLEQELGKPLPPPVNSPAATTQFTATSVL